jgi:hypothetical protein
MSILTEASRATETEPHKPLNSDDTAVSGTLHAYVAFDWGEEIHLDQARRLQPTESQELARRRRTPASIAYRPAPLRYLIAMPNLNVPELDGTAATAEAKVFDFGAVSVAIHLPFTLSRANLVRLAAALSEPGALIEAVRAAVEPLYSALSPAIDKPHFSKLSEEYFVFQLAPGPPLPEPAALVSRHVDWLAAMARLEADPLSAEEAASAVQARISYSPGDLLVAEWSAAVLVDRDCEETLQVIEFANVQLLEFRFLDDLLDDRLADAYRLIHRLARSWLPFWRLHDRTLRALGELKIDVNSIYERTGNVLKLVGDQYLARVYQIVSGRFHLHEWSQSIERSLAVVQSVYQVVSDQSATYRAEFLEILIIALILFEIVMAFVRD